MSKAAADGFGACKTPRTACRAVDRRRAAAERLERHDVGEAAGHLLLLLLLLGILLPLRLWQRRWIARAVGLLWGLRAVGLLGALERLLLLLLLLGNVGVVAGLVQLMRLWTIRV